MAGCGRAGGFLAVLAVSRSPVKVWAAVGRTLRLVLQACRRLTVLVVHDLLDQLDDTAAQFGVLDPHESLGQRQSV